MTYRKAFTFLPLVVLLGLSMAALGLIIGLNTPPKVTGNGAYDSGNRFGALVGPAIIAAFFIWLASRVAERRSEGMANAIFGSILLLMNLAYGVKLYRVLNGIPQPQVAQRNRPSPFAPSTPQPSTPSASTTPRPAFNNQPSAAPTPRPPTASHPPAPASPSPHEVAEMQADAKARPVIEAFELKLLEEIKGPADAAEGFANDIAKPPAHDKRVLKERTADADALRNALTKLETRLKSADEDLERELAAAGIEAFDARHRSARWSSEFSNTPREFAVGRVIALCDRVKNECELLDRDFAAWTLTKGEITVKDVKRRHELTTERFFIEADIPQLKSTLTTLREGR